MKQVADWWELWCVEPKRLPFLIENATDPSSRYLTREDVRAQKRKRKNQYDKIVHVRRYRRDKSRSLFLKYKPLLDWFSMQKNDKGLTLYTQWWLRRQHSPGVAFEAALVRFVEESDPRMNDARRRLWEELHQSDVYLDVIRQYVQTVPAAMGVG